MEDVEPGLRMGHPLWRQIADVRRTVKHESSARGNVVHLVVLGYLNIKAKHIAGRVS